MKIGEQHRKILALRLRGESQKRIASEIGISELTLKKVLDDEVFKLAQDLAVEIITGEIPYHPSLASKKEIMKMDKKPERIRRTIAEDEAVNPKIKLQALRDLEDRGFGKPTEHVIFENVFDVLMRVQGSRLSQGMVEE